MTQRFLMAASLALVLAGGAVYAQANGEVQASTQLLSAEGGRIVFSGPYISAIGPGWNADGVTNRPELSTQDRLVVDIGEIAGCQPRVLSFEMTDFLTVPFYNAFVVRQAPRACAPIEAVMPSRPDSQRPPRFLIRERSAVLGSRG